MIDEAIEMKDEDLKTKLVIAIANQMKKSYVNWNSDTVEDEVIFNQLKKYLKTDYQFLKTLNYLNLFQTKIFTKEKTRKKIELTKVNTETK